MPDFDQLDVQPIVKPRRYTRGSERKRAEFWNRLIAFYAYVRDQVGASDFPHPSGVRVSDATDRQLMDWCIAAVFKRISEDRRNRDFGFAWMDKGPSPRENVPDGEIHIDIAVAYPNGLDYEPQRR